MGFIYETEIHSLTSRVCQCAKSHKVHVAQTLGQCFGHNDQNHDLSLGLHELSDFWQIDTP